MICAAWLQGEAALGLGDLPAADEYLHHALARARMVNLVEEELPALVGLAELRRRKGNFDIIGGAHDKSAPTERWVKTTVCCESL